MSIIATLLCGLGLFFIGARSLSANLVPLVGRRTRAVFAWALRSPLSSAISGTLAGVATQSSNAVSWIIMGFLRAGILPPGPALVAPTWSNVGTAMLPLLVAIDTTTAASVVIGLVGIATYFKLARTDRLRNMLEAALGAAFLLFGMHIISSTVGPVRDDLVHGGGLAMVLHSPWLLAAVGAGFSFAAQSSSVAAAVAVAAVGSGLLTLPAALPLIAGANAAAILNNLMVVPGESGDGRLIFVFQAVQKAGGALFLAVAAVIATEAPDTLQGLADHAGMGVAAEIAVLFTLAQVAGSLVVSLGRNPIATLAARLAPPSAGDTLAQPAFLLREALSDPPVALDLAMRELARLSERLPLLLDHVRAEPDKATPTAQTLRAAGTTLAQAIRTYIRLLLDNQPRQVEVAAALLLEDAVGNAGELHETLAELAATVPAAAALSTTGNLVEALHTLLSVVAGYAESLGADDADLTLGLLGHRDQLMDELRRRLVSGSDAAAPVQDALFRLTILFERAVWLARRLVVNIGQVQRTLTSD
ncbi:MAG: hypothetical protein PW843_24660 [Azospirillaceae bacterium]|nr:hypothetical protein [Azospirillaceae bacterium]